MTKSVLYPLPESCVGLFITLGTEWILKRHIKTNMLAQQSQQSESYTARLPFGSTRNTSSCDKHFLYKTYRGILFQTVALSYLLHVVQNASSKSILKHICLHNNLKNQKIAWPGFHLGAPQKHKSETHLILYER